MRLCASAEQVTNVLELPTLPRTMDTAGRPLVNAMRTASRLNSSLWRRAIIVLLDGNNPIQEHGTKP